jgi:folate-dependent phosphoribosylglycinamide formyltransferase PurN
MTSPKILFIGGTHYRHLYYADQINKKYPLAGSVLQVRKGMKPVMPESGKHRDRKLLYYWTKHFENRVEAEQSYFGQPTSLITNEIKSHDDLNSKGVISFVKEINPDIALIFGCGMIKGELAEALPELTINLHLGLSPRYRGAATLFWPFYFLEPQWAGCTFHKIVDEPDAGDILHQCVPELERGDKIHDVACKAVMKATEDMIKLLNRYCLGYGLSPDKQHFTTGWRFSPQSTTGKNFLSRDFQPPHLRMIYETYNDDIVDQYLDGNLKQHKRDCF